MAATQAAAAAATTDSFVGLAGYEARLTGPESLPGPTAWTAPVWTGR